MLDLDGRKFAAYSWGDGPTVLLVHGWSGNAGQMAEFVAPLTRAGFRAVAIDLPAHGASGGGLSSVVHFARAIWAAAEHFGPVHGYRFALAGSRRRHSGFLGRGQS